MGFDAAGVRGASAGLGALARRAGANGEALLRKAHDAIRLPEDGIGKGFGSKATGFLASAEGKAALHKALEAAWDLMRGIFGGGGPTAGPAHVAHAPPPAPGGAPPSPDRSGTVA